MRLIDADLLSEELNSFSMRITGSANSMAIAVMEETKKSITKMIDEQPTAYDVDKVMEQIRKFEICGKCLNNHNSLGICAEFCDVGKKLKIVKSGGIE